MVVAALSRVGLACFISPGFCFLTRENLLESLLDIAEMLAQALTPKCRIGVTGADRAEQIPMDANGPQGLWIFRQQASRQSVVDDPENIDEA